MLRCTTFLFLPWLYFTCQGILGDQPNEIKEKEVKMAFAEGYLAAEGGGKKKNTRTMRWVKTFQQVLTVIVLLVLLASLMGKTQRLS